MVGNMTIYNFVELLCDKYNFREIEYLFYEYKSFILHFDITMNDVHIRSRISGNTTTLDIEKCVVGGVDAFVKHLDDIHRKMLLIEIEKL